MAEIVSISSETPVMLGEMVSPGSVEIRGVYGASPFELSSLASENAVELALIESQKPSTASLIESRSPVAWYPAGEPGSGNSWWYGDGLPSSEIPAVSGDLYYDTLTGNVYAFE